jgi:hypothetical protein
MMGSADASLVETPATEESRGLGSLLSSGSLIERKGAVMIEPISLGAIGAVALSEGVKFLYAQAGELLKHWREHKDQPQEAPSGPELRAPADLIEGRVDASPPNLERLDRLEGEIRELRRSVADYADGVEEVDPSDVAFLNRVDDLRQAIEVVYQQRITFKGEDREPSGPLVENEVLATEARIRKSSVGTVEATSGTVSQKVDVAHADIEDSTVGSVTIGSPRPKEE